MVFGGLGSFWLVGGWVGRRMRRKGGEEGVEGWRDGRMEGTREKAGSLGRGVDHGWSVGVL